MKKNGFTLAEVLITLGIIGVVAALTMPPLIAKYKEKVTITKLKKFYSVMSQAYQSAVFDNGTADTWGLTTDGAGAVRFLNVLTPYFNAKNCGLGLGCAPNVTYKHLNGGNDNNPATDTNLATMLFNDGTHLWLSIASGNCTSNRGTTKELQSVCALGYIDTNGFKPPNKIGVDAFFFYWSTDRVIPSGTRDDTSYPFQSRCQVTGGLSGAQGQACTAWAITNENMEYLRCNNLSWSGKTKCN